MDSDHGERVYKVTSPDQTSVYAKGPALVYYSIETKTKSSRWLADRGYHLTAFKELQHARDFVKRISNVGFLLWEAEGWGEVMLSFCCSLESLSQGVLSLYESPRWPEGTVMFRSMRLIRVIEES